MSPCNAPSYVLLLGLAFVAASADTIVAEIPIENAILKLAKEVAVSAESTGRLAELTVREGEPVKKGQVLAKIDDGRVQIEWRQSKIELKTAEVEHANLLSVQDAELSAEVADNELERALEANRRVPETFREAEIERYKLAAERAKLQIEQSRHERKVKQLDVMAAQARLDAVADSLRRHRVLAPWDGLVLAIDATPGKWVEAGTEILTIVDTRKLRVEGFVSSEFSVDDLVNAEVEVRIVRRGGESESLAGRVSFVSPDVNPVNTLARIFIDLDNPARRLRPGWKVDASLLPVNLDVETPAGKIGEPQNAADDDPRTDPDPDPDSDSDGRRDG